MYRTKKHLGLSQLYSARGYATGDEENEGKEVKRHFSGATRGAARWCSVGLVVLVGVIIGFLMWTAFPSYCEAMNAYNQIQSIHNSTTGDIKALTLNNNYTRGEIRIGTTNRAGVAAQGLGFRGYRMELCRRRRMSVYSTISLFT